MNRPFFSGGGKIGKMAVPFRTMTRIGEGGKT